MSFQKCECCTCSGWKWEAVILGVWWQHHLQGLMLVSPPIASILACHTGKLADLPFSHSSSISLLLSNLFYLPNFPHLTLSHPILSLVTLLFPDLWKGNHKKQVLKRNSWTFSLAIFAKQVFDIVQKNILELGIENLMRKSNQFLISLNLS